MKRRRRHKKKRSYGIGGLGRVQDLAIAGAETGMVIGMGGAVKGMFD